MLLTITTYIAKYYTTIGLSRIINILSFNRRQNLLNFRHKITQKLSNKKSPEEVHDQDCG